MKLHNFFKKWNWIKTKI